MAPVLATALVGLATSGHGVASTVPPPTAPPTYTSTTFVVPFEVTPPDWLAPGTAPTAERPHFVTWESTDPERALRILAPATVIQPPNADEIEVPDDYVDYVLSLSEFGASVEDVVETTVDGMPATVATVTSPHSIDGAFGCEEPPAGECWGPIPDAVLRMAFIDVGDQVLLVWQRDPKGAEAIDYASFDAMLASLDIREDTAPATEPAVVDTTAPVGSDPRLPEGDYRTPELTREQLIATGVNAGFEEADVTGFVDGDGIDSTASFGLRLENGSWTQLYSYDGEPEGIGWRGTYEVVDDDTVIATDPCGPITYDYAFDGEQLTLDVVDDQCGGGADVVDLIAQTIIFESAPFTLAEPDRIPDGTYTRVATREQGEALGLDDAFLDAALGADGAIPFTIEISGDRWTQLSTNDAGITEIGDEGTASYDEDGRWVTVSESTGCPGCVGVFDWTFDDGKLTLAFARIEGAEDIPADARFVIEGVYRLQEEPTSTTEPAAATVTLRFANPADSAPPQLVAFAEEVQRLSNGSIEFEWLPAYGVDAANGAYSNAEATIVADLADSAVDIGWVGARALPGFEALLAPMLVDNHDLQEQVFAAGIPERMLGELGEHGLVGITVMPGPLRRLAGVEHPFATPADFAGATIANDVSALAVATMDALGATSTPGASGLPLDGLDAVLAHFAAITGNGYHTQADSVVANVNFWPRPLVIVMSAESFEALSPEQQEALMTAGANAVEPAMQASRDEDSLAGAELCNAPIQVIEASEADLAQLATALEPVFDDLASDPHSAAYLDEIRSLKDELGAPPDTLACPAE